MMTYTKKMMNTVNIAWNRIKKIWNYNEILVQLMNLFNKKKKKKRQQQPKNPFETNEKYRVNVLFKCAATAKQKRLKYIKDQWTKCYFIKWNKKWYSSKLLSMEYWKKPRITKCQKVCAISFFSYTRFTQVLHLWNCKTIQCLLWYCVGILIRWVRLILKEE